MYEVSQKLRTVHYSRAGPSKIRVGVNCIHSSVTNSWNLVPPGISRKLAGLFHYLREIESARSQNQNFRRPLQHVIPIDTNRIGALSRKLVHASRKSHHLRHPMAATIDRI